MPNLFDAQTVGRVRSLELRSFRLAESFLSGMHRSRLRGISTEFAQHRSYVPGDDPRHLDWKVYAKTDRFYIKQYAAETNLQVRLLVDTSPSMFFKSPDAALTKFEYAATVAATLAYLLLQQKDVFGLALFDEKVRAYLPPKGSAAHFRRLLELLSNAAPGSKTDVADALLTVGPQARQRGLIVVLSDFVAETDRLGLGLGQMSFRGHDVLLFRLEDPVERDFPFDRQTIFLGLEGEGRYLCDPRDLRNAYLNERNRHREALREVSRRFGYDLTDLPTDAPPDAALSTVLSHRLARRRQR